MNTLKKIFGTILGIVLVGFLIQAGMKLQEKRTESYPWTGSFYNLTFTNTLTDSETFKTIENCRTWANEKAKAYDLKEGQWDYDCGKDCTYTEDTVVSGKNIKSYECLELSK